MKTLTISINERKLKLYQETGFVNHILKEVLSEINRVLKEEQKFEVQVPGPEREIYKFKAPAGWEYHEEQKECIQCEKETKHYIKENNMVSRCLSCGVIWRCKK